MDPRDASASKNTTGKSFHVTLWSANAYQYPPYNATASMPHSVTKWMNFKYWAANLSHFLQFWCSSVNHEAKCVHLQPPWSFWWHLAHIWKFGFILDFMSLMTPALPTALGYYLVAAFQKDKSHPTAGFRMSRVFPHRLCSTGIASQHQWCLAVWVETGFHCKQLRFCLASSLVVSLAVCGPGHTLQNS